jgi:hypothetical protein
MANNFALLAALFLSGNAYADAGHSGAKALSATRGGRLKIIAAIADPAVIVGILTHLSLPARAPPRSPARPLPLFQAA